MKVLAADYMDCHTWGVVTEDNRIVVGYTNGLTKEMAEVIAERINKLLEEARQESSREG